MDYRNLKTEDFYIEVNKANTCDGCWFAANSGKVNCRKDGARFVDTVFNQARPKLKGSCFRLIAKKKSEKQAATTPPSHAEMQSILKLE